MNYSIICVIEKKTQKNNLYRAIEGLPSMLSKWELGDYCRRVPSKQPQAFIPRISWLKGILGALGKINISWWKHAQTLWVLRRRRRVRPRWTWEIKRKPRKRVSSWNPPTIKQQQTARGMKVNWVPKRSSKRNNNKPKKPSISGEEEQQKQALTHQRIRRGMVIIWTTKAIIKALKEIEV